VQCFVVFLSKCLAYLNSVSPFCSALSCTLPSCLLLSVTDGLPWTCLEYVKLNETDTTSSSRIFIKVLVQELSEMLGTYKRRTKHPYDPHNTHKFLNHTTFLISSIPTLIYSHPLTIQTLLSCPHVHPCHPTLTLYGN
jgi:hypothetical protein